VSDIHDDRPLRFVLRQGALYESEVGGLVYWAAYARLEQDRDHWRQRAEASGNYVCDKECEPTKVTFSNGRVVRVAGDGYLEIERE